jgi:hypothetical protein
MQLRNEGMPSIKLSQLKYQITKYDKVHNPSQEFTMRDIVNWSETHATRPEDTDTPFVTKYLQSQTVSESASAFLMISHKGTVGRT